MLTSLISKWNADIIFWIDIWMTGFVKESATWQSVLMWFKTTVWCWRWCMIWWKRSEICFVSFVQSLFYSIYIAAEHSISMVVAGMTISSVYGIRSTISNTNLRSHVTSSTQEERATYSASPDESATAVWSINFQKIWDAFTAKIYPKVDRLVEIYPPQSASTTARKLSRIILRLRGNIKPKWRVPLTYLKILLAKWSWRASGAWRLRVSAAIENVRYGSLPYDKYEIPPTTAR